MRTLIAKSSKNAERIFPYIGGDEVNTSPTHQHHRYVIDFFDRPLRREQGQKHWQDMDDDEHARCRTTGIVPDDYPGEVAEDWPDLVEIVRRLVKPERDVQKRDALRVRWWQYAEKRPGLYSAITALKRVLVTTRVSQFLAITQVDSGQVYSEQLIPLAFASMAAFSAVQSRCHELWTRFFASTLEERLRYVPSDCFRTFPFRSILKPTPALKPQATPITRFARG